MVRRRNLLTVILLLLFISISGISCGGEKKKKKVKSETERSFEKGNDYLKLNKVDSAIKEYEKTIQYDPKHKMAHHNLGIAYLKRERYEDAISQYEAYLKYADEEEDAEEIENVKKLIERLKKK